MGGHEPTTHALRRQARLGHYEEFLAHPALLMLRAWRECGDFAEFDLGGVRTCS